MGRVDYKKETQAPFASTLASSSQANTLGVTLTITQRPMQPTSGGDQPLDKSIPLTKTCQDGSPLVLGAQPKVEKKVDEPKDSIATLVPSPTSSLVPSTSPALLLPCNPHV